MNPNFAPARIEFHREDRMLFVRTEGILETVASIPLIFAGLIVVTLTIPLQPSFSSTRALDLSVYSDGSVHISALIDIDPLDPDFEVELFGSSIDNFAAVGEDGFLLSSEVIDNKATIDTFGSSYMKIDYEIHDLISKEGRIWTFTFDSPAGYSLLMPTNSIIVGMNVLPINMEIENDHTKLDLDKGFSEINYIFGTSQLAPVPTEPSADLLLLTLTGTSVASAAIGIMVMMRRRQAKPDSAVRMETVPKTVSSDNLPDAEAIFRMRPHMRESDREIVRFIAEKGGKLLESDLRKKFLQPRTTMWRAVKRLERQGVVEISKENLQNLIKIRKDMEEEE